MTTPSTVCITAITVFSFVFILCIVLSYDISKSFHSISKKDIRVSVTLYLLSLGIASISFTIYNIVQYLALSESSSNSPLLKAIQIITLFTRFTSYCTLYISIAAFLKIKLQHSYQHTFLSINKSFINICFIIFIISAIFSIGLFVIVNCVGAYYTNLATDSFQSVFRWATLQFCVILNVYLILILILFNVKLHKFLALTMKNDLRLSSAINTKTTNAIIKQTNLMTNIINSSIIFQIIYFIRWIETSKNNDIAMIYNLLYAFLCISSLLCIYFTFHFNTDGYGYFCEYCHLCCIWVCSKTFSSENKIAYQGVALRRLSTKKSISRLSLKKSDEFHRQIICSNICECTAVTAICEMLQKHDEFATNYDSNNYELCDILNHFHHLLEFHDSADHFDEIYGKLTGDGIKCDYQNCKLYSRHYSRRRRIKSESNECTQLLDSNTNYTIQRVLDKMHSFYYHSYDTHLRNTVEERRLKEDDRIPHMINLFRSRIDIENDENMNNNKFSSSFSVKQDDHNKSLYSFGKRYEYEDENDAWFVKPRYDTLKQELVDNETCSISMEIYDIEYEKCTLYMEQTYRIKEVQNRNERKELTIQHLLALFIYCNCDEYQNKWSATYRHLCNDEKDEELKQRHSYFYYISWYLRQLIEDWGQRLIDIGDNDNDNDKTHKTDNNHKSDTKTFYHGVNQLMYLTRTMTQFNGPLSTSTEPIVALRFSNGEGIVLELKYASSTYPLNAKFFDCQYFSNYVNEKECLFIGGIPQLIIINIINASTGIMYRKYINSLNIINSLFNGTYNPNNNNIYNCSDRSLSLCCQLLSYQLRSTNKSDSDQITNNNDDEDDEEKKEEFPEYVINLLNEFCINLSNIMIFWEQINMIEGIQQLLYNKQNNLFFDLNVLLRLFPNLQQIEYYNQSTKSLECTVQKIVNHVIKCNVESTNNLKYVIIHHKCSTLSKSETEDWNLYQDEKGIILHKNNNNDINRDLLNLHYHQIIQASTSKQMNENLEEE